MLTTELAAEKEGIPDAEGKQHDQDRNADDV
jgi:hypothetical protein